MKPISRMLTLIVCIVVGVVVFALLFNLTKPAQPRIPSPEYSTLAEEYIDAIETFNNTGKVVVPKGSRFSYDGKTIIIKDPKSTEASLTNGKHGVTVGFKDYPWLAFWSPNAPFVCIEPWYSHTDFEEVRVPFEQREGTLVLKPHETFETSYSIRIW